MLDYKKIKNNTIKLLFSKPDEKSWLNIIFQTKLLYKCHSCVLKKMLNTLKTNKFSNSSIIFIFAFLLPKTSLIMWNGPKRKAQK